MKQTDTSLEIQAIATMLDSNSRIQHRMMSELTLDHFIEKGAARECYERLLWYLQTGHDVPSSRVLSKDPALSKRAAGILRHRSKRHPDRIRRFRDLDGVITSLNTYMTHRSLLEIGEAIAEVVDGEVTDEQHAETLAAIEERLHAMRVGKTNIAPIHLGTDDTADAYFKSLAEEADTSKFLPTGWKPFDDEFIGLSLESFAVFSANYGGGKSILVEQLLLHNYLHNNVSTCFVSVEMGSTKCMDRLIACGTGIPYNDIKTHRLTPQQLKLILNFRKRMTNHGKKHGIRFSIETPSGLNIWDVYHLLKPYNYKVIAIDYINLLDPLPGTEKKDERIQLGASARAMKIISREAYLGALIITPAQLNEEDKVKYALAMAEHADYVFIWRRDEHAKEVGRITMRLDKGRDIDASMKLVFETNFHISRMDCIGNLKNPKVASMLANDAPNSKGGSKGNRKTTKRKKPRRGMTSLTC